MKLLGTFIPWKNPEECQVQDYRLFVIIQVIASLGLLVQAGFFVFFAILASWPMAIAHGIGLAIWLWILGANRQGNFALAVGMMAIDVACHVLIATYFIGWDAGFHFYLLAAIPISFLNPRKQERSSLIAVLCTVLGGTIAIQSQAHLHPMALTPALTRGLNAVNLFLAFVSLALSCHYFRRASQRTEEKIYHLAHTDDLTGLINRRRMETILQEQIDHINRYGGHLTIALADIDKFKAVNDTYGHSSGDQALQTVSAIFRDKLRKTDWISRWGGEEFLLLLNQTHLQGSHHAIEKLRRIIANRPIYGQGKEFHITVTFGLAEYKAGMTLHETVAIADAMLYQGKRLGRNRIESALTSQQSQSNQPETSPTIARDC